MPVHFTVASHDAQPIERASHLQKPEELLIRSGKTVCAELLQSSFGKEVDLSSVFGSTNGFVGTVTTAYKRHHHLIFKPDDVWIAILGQFNLYVNANAEELRSRFVHHADKKELVVEATGTKYTADFGALAHQMTDQLHQNVVDKDLQQWILPDFTTTTLSDTVICSVIMMSTMKAYFVYNMSPMCGIPSVTLEGEKSDWERLLARLDKLDSFGEEPKAWAAMLRPILTRFVRAFDGEPDVDFWSRVCDFHPQGSGPTYLSGWITAFCVWSKLGKWQGPPISGPPSSPITLIREETTVPEFVLDMVSYPVITSDGVPIGIYEVEVKLDDNVVSLLPCIVMASGHLAYSVEGEKKDTIRPLASWFIYVKDVLQPVTRRLVPTTQEEKEKTKTKWTWKFGNT